MKTKFTILLISILVLLSGCAKFQNEMAANGGIVGSYKADYVVRNDSGGRIMDVWILRDVIVQSERSGSGWFFKDNDGHVIHLSGDVKVIRCNSSTLGSSYHEYHAEFETKTYQELYSK